VLNLLFFLQLFYVISVFTVDLLFAVLFVNLMCIIVLFNLVELRPEVMYFVSINLTVIFFI